MPEQQSNATTYRSATLDSCTRRGSRGTAKARRQEIALTRAGDIDGSEATIIDGAMFAAALEDPPPELVAYCSSNGNTITETLRNGWTRTARNGGRIASLSDPTYLRLLNIDTGEGRIYA